MENGEVEENVRILNEIDPHPKFPVWINRGANESDVSLILRKRFKASYEIFKQLKEILQIDNLMGDGESQEEYKVIKINSAVEHEDNSIHKDNSFNPEHYKLPE